MPARGEDDYGPLALLGGGEFQSGVALDAELLAGEARAVLVLPTAAAYEHPERVLERAAAWFESLGASVVACPVLRRTDAEDEHFATAVRAASFIYLTGGSPLHLRAVLKDSLVLHALVAAWREGAVLVGSGAGAMVLTDPMLDPRGGAFTVGFGLVRNLSVLPDYDGQPSAQLRRTIALAPEGCPLVALPAKTAIVRDPDGSWRISGGGEVALYLDGGPAGLEALAGKATW